MTYAFTFKEINYGRIEIDSDTAPDNATVVEKIMDGEATFDDTEYENIQLVEAGGKPVGYDAHDKEVDVIATLGKYLQYLRDWADDHSTPEYYGMSPACFDEWYNCECSEDEDE